MGPMDNQIEGPINSCWTRLKMGLCFGPPYAQLTVFNVFLLMGFDF